MGSDIRIIAEAGVNHDGDLAKAITLVHAAAEAGADTVKFQVFQAEEVCHPRNPMADYQRANLGTSISQRDMVARYQLSYEAFVAIAAEAERSGIAFLASPFGLSSLDFLVRVLGQTEIKVASGEVTHVPLLVQAGRTAEKILLSTGASSLGDVERALTHLAFGMVGPSDEIPTEDELMRLWATPSTQELLRSRVTILHCVTQYPAPPDQHNLIAISTLAAAFGTRVGFSDHSLGTHLPSAAVALGATVIEKHLTLDSSAPGPDHAASLEPKQFQLMVRAIRDTAVALGNGRKVPAKCEEHNRRLVRRRIAASRPIAEGEAFTAGNLHCLRAPDGMEATHWFRVLGTKADRDYRVDDLVPADLTEDQ